MSFRSNRPEKRDNSIASPTPGRAGKTTDNSRQEESRSRSSSFFIMVTGEIQSASFRSSVDNLYCRYSFALGLDWDIVHGVSTGLSQLARRQSGCPRNSIAWNFPIDIAFKTTNAYGWPRIAIAVYGVDALGRDVVRGYGSLTCPTAPGRYIKHVNMYAPVSGSMCQRFINWIAGTLPEFYDTKFVTQGEGRAVTRVRSAGIVKVVLSITSKDMEAFGYDSAPIASFESK